jgi:hypothetical protein
MSDLHHGSGPAGDRARASGAAHPPSGAAPAAAPHHSTDFEEFDRDLNVPAILWTTAGVIVITLLSVVAMWGMFKGFAFFEARSPAPPSPMGEAGRQVAPPEPRLQPAPPEDMEAMRKQDARLLEHAGWIDRTQGTVRVPITVAIDVLAERGLPRVTTPLLAVTAARGTYAADGRPPTDQPSPGTLLPPPGLGIGSLGPPSAGAGQLPGAAQPEPVPAAGAQAPGAPGGAAAKRPPRAERPPRTPILPPPPPGGRP